MRIFHLALRSDWEQAQRTGRYTTSTLGRTLAQEGFIHASRGDQWQAVRRRFYAEVTEPLVLLVIDPDLLEAPVVDEPVPGTTETFPHVYGALETSAVVRVVALDPHRPDVDGRATHATVPAGQPEAGPPHESFSRVYFRELFHYVVLVSVVMTVVVLAVLAGLATTSEWGPLVGALAGLLLGVALARALHRRRERQLDAVALPPS